ncbi:MAG: hypothetical protein R3C30_05100 [Hyphomonadaceae bacterium]
MSSTETIDVASSVLIAGDRRDGRLGSGAAGFGCCDRSIVAVATRDSAKSNRSGPSGVRDRGPLVGETITVSYRYGRN